MNQETFTEFSYGSSGIFQLHLCSYSGVINYFLEDKIEVRTSEKLTSDTLKEQVFPNKIREPF